jgi:hypothetical protein
MPSKAMPSVPEITRVSTLNHYQCKYEQYFGLMGETLLFQTNSFSLMEAAIAAFDRFPLPEPISDHPLVVRLFVREGVSEFLSSNDSYPDPIFNTQQHIFSITVGSDSLGIADLKQGFACGYINPQIADDQSFVRYTFIEGLSLSMLSMHRGYVPIHAACVIKNGIAVIIQASSGTGKSTIAYTCLKRGYQILAEDVVHLKVGGDKPQLWGSPWNLHLLPDTQEIFPELSGQKPRLQMNGEWKIELNVENLYPNSTVVCADLGVVVILRRGQPGTSQLIPLDAMEASDEFEILWPWDSGWTETHEQAIMGLISKGVYILEMSGPPDEAVDLLDRLSKS